MPSVQEAEPAIAEQALLIQFRYPAQIPGNSGNIGGVAETFGASGALLARLDEY